MLKKTHIYIANHVYDQLSEQDQSLLSRYALANGSVFPDLNLHYRLTHHSYSKTILFIRRHLTDILKNKQSRYDLSHQLGIIMHFMCDYATSYHSNPKYVNCLMKHYGYEKHIHTLVHDWQPPTEDMPTIHDLATLEDELERYLETYQYENIANPLDNLNHAISLSTSITHLIISAYKKNHLKPNFSPSSIRVAIFSDTYYPHINGVSNTLFQMLNHYETHQIPYVLISPKYKEKAPEMEQGFSIHKVTAVPFIYYPQTMMSVPKRRHLDAILDDFRPTVIHAMTEFNLGFYGLRYATKHHIPFVSNYSTHFHLGLKHMRLSLFHKPLSRYIKWFHNQASVTTTPSHDTEQFLHSLGIQKTAVFSRGIDTHRFSPEHRDEQLRKSWDAEHHQVLLYVGRISGEKNLYTLLDAYEMLDSKLKQNTKLVLVGDGPLLVSIRSKYKHIITTGFLTGEELHKAYASADLFVFPSTSETLGNVVLEAMASGLPVIGVAKGGVKENIIDGYNGFLVEKNDVDLIHDAITQMLENQKLYLEMKRNALEFSHHKTWASEFNRLIILFQQQLNQNQQTESYQPVYPSIICSAHVENTLLE
jgi:phosphatidylinositol alpha 1,6-mannosyltransferase